MSLATKLAQGAAADAEQDWKRHQGVCQSCHPRGGRPAVLLCPAGSRLKTAAAAARTAARAEAEADREPNPDQETLF